MVEGWATKTGINGKKMTIWHFYRNGKALCNQSNFMLDVDKLKPSPEISQKNNQIVCKKCREKWSRRK